MRQVSLRASFAKAIRVVGAERRLVFDANRVVEVEAGVSARSRWHLEDFPGNDPGDYLAAKREIDLAGECTILAPLRDAAPIGFAELVRDGPDAEIAGVYIAPEHRGRGLGTALTRAAIERGAGARELWIGADEEDRPKRLYARLGFRAAWTGAEFLLMP